MEELDPNLLMSRLQQHFSDGLVIIVGSGLSCAEGLPGMGELADHLKETVENDLSGPDNECWAQLSTLIAAKGLEAALLEQTPTPQIESSIMKRTTELIAQKEQEIVAQVFERSRTLTFTKLLKHILKPDDGIPVVTTNYDRLLEVATEEAGLGVDTMFIGQFAATLKDKESNLSFCRSVQLRGRQVRYRFQPRVNLFKPHGSLDWYDRGGTPVRSFRDLPLPRLIITPGLNKFRNGYHSPFDRHRERANAAIDRAKRFVVLGYGFNDDHLETHLTPKIAAGVPTLILTRTLSRNALSLVNQHQNIVAIQRKLIGGEIGSSIHFQREAYDRPQDSLWDLETFISEVLEP